MKVKKEVVVGLIVIVLIASLVMVFLGYNRNKQWDTLAGQIAALSPGNGPPETIQGLRTAINAYEAKIEQQVKDAAQTGIYWKILAYRLQDKGLHGEALEALERAIAYNPMDAALHYMVGVSAGVVAKSSLNFEGNPGNLTRDNYYTLAENGYLRAISLDERYVRPLYGLGVLYAFELDRPREAIPYLMRSLEISPDVDTMFVLARSYYMIEAYREAVAVYERIIDFTKDLEKVNEAQMNRQRILDIIYG
ncbi:tetratricopeptide repeat protein [Treponema primitia]|uniref:tetratricopeptide repeat protein n=1 Tax=Treponema primitia TaxID=88058 RepID=UPI000255533E|nr:tetratricopeptide repeat protein [Treponema primitia]